MTDAMLDPQESMEGAAAVLEECRPAEEDSVVREQIEERPEPNMGARASQVALKLMSRVELHVAERKLGKTFGSDCGCHLPDDEGKKARFPDGSFVGRGRLPDERTPEGNLRLAPDLAVEVVSPNDGAYEVEDTRFAYLRAGVKLLWVVYPPTRTVYVFRANGSVALLGETDTISGEDVLTDFTCPVARFFEDP